VDKDDYLLSGAGFRGEDNIVIFSVHFEESLMFFKGIDEELVIFFFY
jgi:hypothetical protein